MATKYDHLSPENLGKQEISDITFIGSKAIVSLSFYLNSCLAIGIVQQLGKKNSKFEWWIPVPLHKAKQSTFLQLSL